MVIKLSSPATKEFWELPVLYKDESLLALDKPAGLATVPAAEEVSRPSLMALLHAGIAEGKPWAKERGLEFLMNAHRLDEEASGILLLAKAKAAQVRLLDLFGNEEPTLSFSTVVQGTRNEERFTINVNIATDPNRQGLMRADSRNGKRARTQFEVVERFEGWLLLQCTPLTLRPDQIRVHLRHARLPIAGDEAYGGKPLLLSRLKPGFRLKPHHSERPLLSTPRLHASRLVIEHPDTGKTLEVQAPMPKDLSVALKYLRKYASEQAPQS